MESPMHGGSSDGAPVDTAPSDREDPDRGRSAADADLLEPRVRRTPLLVLGLVALVAVGWLTVDAFRGSVVYYLTPSEALTDRPDEVFRLAGFVVDDSIVRDDGGALHFAVTDGTATIPVRYDGRVPDSLGDGAEAVAEGRLGEDGVFRADSVLARCASKFESELEAELAPGRPRPAP
jgi:cytochrome c-type biogenesis protein CcmE